MNNKILIGSIMAVALLIGVSFTSVVGYRSVASDVKASPLFNIRSSRAIDEESDDLRCEYVGKGEVGLPSFPKREDKIDYLDRFIKSIKKMDDNTFSRFVDLVINHLHQENNFKDKNLDDTVNQFKHLNFYQIDLLDDLKNNYDPPTMTPSMYDCCTIRWTPRDCFITIYSPFKCFFFDLFFTLKYIIALMKIIISKIYDYLSWNPDC